MKTEELNKLKQECLNCKKCVLGDTRINVVFSDGNPETAKAILIGEAPGENEDKTGTPFVGRAGKLLNEFLEKAEISREKDLYIINTVKCRPPQNRVPTDKEKKECEETGSWRTGCLCSDYGSWIYGGVLLFLQPFSERNYDQWYRLQQQDSHAGEKEDSETAWAV